MLLLIQESKSRRFLTKFGLIPSNVFFRLGSAQSKLGVSNQYASTGFKLGQMTIFGHFFGHFWGIIFFSNRQLESKKISPPQSNQCASTDSKNYNFYHSKWVQMV